MSGMRRDRERSAEAKAKAPVALADRLRAAEEALVAARATIAQQEKREAELRRRLDSGGGMRDDQQGDSALEAKVGALKKMQDQKVRALMKSIGQLQAQVQALKAQDQEHRRSALIQNLRKQQREQELVIDTLKQTLLDKVPEFNSSRAAVNDFVIKKTVGGPLRFRPKTREELEGELWQVDQKYRSAMEQLRHERKRSGSSAQDTTRRSSSIADADSGDEDQPAEKLDEDALLPQDEDNALDVDQRSDPGIEEELARLRVETVGKTATIHSQADEINELYAELDRYRIVEDKVARKKLKIAQLREQLSALEAENLIRVREKEEQAEKCLQLQEELQFLRDLKIDDVGAKDEERLEALEQIQMLRSRELALQNQLEEQQKRWAVDRTNVSQQIRLIEKEKQLLEDEKRIAVNERIAASKKYATALQDVEVAQKTLQDEKARGDGLHKRLKELEEVLAKQEQLSVEERDAFKTSASEKIHELSLEVEQKCEQLKTTERQLNAAKLLVRQTKKEKEQLEERLARLQQQDVRQAASAQA